MGKRRGRPRKTAEQKAKDSVERTQPAGYILDRRKLFSFVEAPKGGEIDSEVCDAIGQLCSLGLLDGHGHDPVELRDKGRFWGGHYAKLMKAVGTKVASYERKDRSEPTGALTGADVLFDRMDEHLPGFERARLLELIVEPLIGEAPTVPWAQALIDMALLERKRFPENRVVRFPTMNDREMLNAAIRGLVILVDGALPHRWAA